MKLLYFVILYDIILRALCLQLRSSQELKEVKAQIEKFKKARSSLRIRPGFRV